ncbi:MAG: cellulase family glycosylhydrolase [Gammaproteobacteria bacterium]|nr:cellulase family glycosylhydrolase [Gammaproteobacteria bacterium]
MHSRIFKLLFIILISLLSLPTFAYTAHDNQIFDSSGNAINIDGVNWSGFQDSGFIDELYGSISFYPYPAGNISFGLIDMLTHPWDYAGTGVTKANSVAFKTIRLPIQPNNLRDTSVNSHFRYDLTNAAAKTQGNGVFCQTWDAQHCTAGISTKESLYTVLNEFKKNNIRVLVDFHQTPVGRNGNVVESNYSLANYSADVKELATQIKSRGLTNVIGIDVFNEPHNLKWFTAAGNQPSWASVIQTAGLAVYQNNPDLLLFVEGPSTTPRSDLHICVPLSGPTTPPAEPNSYTLIQNSQACGSTKYEVVFKSNWGETFSDLLSTTEAAKGNAVFDTAQFKTAVCGSNTAFCTWLLGDPSKPNTYGHLVFSPHVYGQFVATWQSSAKASAYRFDWNWGYLLKAGFPVVIGETGYLPDQATDVAFFEQSVMPYMQSHGMSHNLLYWTWNTNSGDTGGVRADANTTKLVAIKESDLAKLYNGDTSTGTLQISAASGSDTKCNSAIDTLTVDGSSGASFTVSSGNSQTLTTGAHTVSLTSFTSIPAGGGQSGYCTSTLSASQVTISKGQTTSVTATYQYHAPAPTGILQVSAASGSDPNCSNATDTLYLDGSSTGTKFVAKTGIAQTVLTGSHTLSIASLATIPAGGGLSGTCTSTLSAGQVSVTANQTTPVTVTYQYQSTPGMSCTVTSAKVTAQSDWGMPTLVNSFQMIVMLKGFPVDGSGKTDLKGSFIMMNPFVQTFWGENFGIATSSYSGATGQFTGALYGTQVKLGGFINNVTPLSIGSTALKSITLNGILCN